MVAVTEPETVVRLDTPAGLVVARVAVQDGRARSVTLRNVPSFLHAADRAVDVPGLGTVRYDMAFGGNFYALLPAAAVGLEVDPARAQELIDGGLAIIAAIDAADRPVHPEDPRIAGCKHVVFHAPGRDGADARAATSIHPGWLDRSPCGTGTSARLAQLHARGELAIGRAVRQRVGDRHALHRPGGRGDDGRRAGRRSCPRSPAARGSPRWASTCSTPTTRSRRASRCDGRRRGRRRHRRRGGRARARRARRGGRRCSTAAPCRAARPGWARATCCAPTRTPARSSSSRAPGWRSTASWRSGSATRRGSAARAR